DANAADGALLDRDGGNDVVVPCTDGDGDGYGTGCARGVDCDDTDPTVTDQCYHCTRPSAGCPCTTPDVRPYCDTLPDTDLTAASGTCHLGQRVCIDGVWSRCLAVDATKRTIVPLSACGMTCDPACQATSVCPNSASDLAVASGATVSNLVLTSYAASSLC